MLLSVHTCHHTVNRIWLLLTFCNLQILAERASLFDYELIVGDNGKRLLAFGKFAGRAGLIDFLRGLGQRMHYSLSSVWYYMIYRCFYVVISVPFFTELYCSWLVKRLVLLREHMFFFFWCCLGNICSHLHHVCYSFVSQGRLSEFQSTIIYQREE